MKIKFLAPLLLCSLITSCKQEVKTNGEELLSSSTEQTITKQENNEEKQAELNAQKEREKKIEKIKFYEKNRSYTDENGITYALRIEEKEVRRVKKYESEKIYFKDDEYVTVGSYEIEMNYKLTANGELQDDINFYGYALESLRSDYSRANFDMWCIDIFTFIPELEDNETKKKTIARFTGGDCAMGPETNNKIRNERIAAVQASGIIDGELNIAKEHPKENNKKESVTDTKNNTKEDETKLTITVDNLRVRTSPELSSDKIENLTIGSEVVLLEKSTNQTTVTIQNNEITEYWYKVKTPLGNVGWIHGCCFEM